MVHQPLETSIPREVSYGTVRTRLSAVLAVEQRSRLSAESRRTTLHRTRSTKARETARWKSELRIGGEWLQHSPPNSTYKGIEETTRCRDGCAMAESFCQAPS